ncbi:hypothetical protein PUN28_013490 [Cardiocondyla obscurior]|uniref:Uncharacterized protein n=1 Tax=Cardiocondyla obscurior TaxID=286306 RepID=A0AAW2F5A2_9HYME
MSPRSITLSVSKRTTGEKSFAPCVYHFSRPPLPASLSTLCTVISYRLIALAEPVEASSVALIPPTFFLSGREPSQPSGRHYRARFTGMRNDFGSLPPFLE